MSGADSSRHTSITESTWPRSLQLVDRPQTAIWEINPGKPRSRKSPKIADSFALLRALIAPGSMAGLPEGGGVAAGYVARLDAGRGALHDPDQAGMVFGPAKNSRRR